MPLPLSHYAVAYLIHRLNKRLSLPGLVLGSTVPDLGILVHFLILRSMGGREWLHSMVEVATLGTLISVLLTMFLYPTIVSLFFGIKRGEAKGKCWFSRVLVASCLIGGLSHVLLDSTCHEYNPLFYPLSNQSFDALVLMDNWRQAYAIVDGFLLVILSIIIAVELRRGTKGFWERILLS